MGRILSFAIAAAIACCPALSLAADNSEAAVSPVGKSVGDFSLKDYRGKDHALAEHKGKPVVLAFIGAECPLAKSYAPRLQSLSEEFGKQGVAFLGIDANQQDNLTEIGAYARVHGITFPVLKDNNNEIADRLGAVRTPEVFLLDKDHVVRYWGRIDDQYGFKTGAGYVKPKLRDRSLANAITEVLAGKEVSNPVVKADGCFIGRVTKSAPKGDDHLLEPDRADPAEPLRRVPSRGRDRRRSRWRSYDEVVGWAEMIEEVVNEGRMPPWFADPQYGDFSNDCRLSDDEKQQVNAWVDNGCPEGNRKDLPTPRKFVEGWQIGQPDQIDLHGDEPYTVPAEGHRRIPVLHRRSGLEGRQVGSSAPSAAGQPGRGASHHRLRASRRDGGRRFGSRGGCRRLCPGQTPCRQPARHGEPRPGRLEADVPDALHAQRRRSRRIAATWASSSPIPRPSTVGAGRT